MENEKVLKVIEEKEGASGLTSLTRCLQIS